jgi:glutathione peroxidase
MIHLIRYTPAKHLLNKLLNCVAAIGALAVVCVQFQVAEGEEKAGPINSQRVQRMAPSFYSLKARTITGQEQLLSQYQGSVALVVNVASLCGYTEQYRGLQQLYLKYKDRGFVILGFPSNDFGEQEPGSNQEIHNFCTGRFGVTFPLFSKSKVTGDQKNVVYEYLTGHAGKSEVQWNFEKFLVGRDGKVIHRFTSSVDPSSKELLQAIEAALGAARAV